MTVLAIGWSADLISTGVLLVLVVPALAVVLSEASSRTAPRRRTGERSWQRAADLADRMLAAIALLFLLPVLAAIAVAVKATSGGPVLIRNERPGRAGAASVLTFRTTDTDRRTPRGAHGGPCFTPVGRRLVRSGLDGLPRLFDAVRGESLFLRPGRR